VLLGSDHRAVRAQPGSGALAPAAAALTVGVQRLGAGGVVIMPGDRAGPGESLRDRAQPRAGFPQSRRLARKDGGPVVPDTHHGPPIGLSLAECLLGPNPVVELSLCVVM
jgi:hypothetical protein